MRAQPTNLGGQLTTQSVDRRLTYVARVLNGNVTFGSTIANGDQNLNVWKAAGTTPGANTNFTVKHSLGRIPVTIVGQDTDNGGLLYRGSVAWTATTVTLKCTTSGANYNVIIG